MNQLFYFLSHTRLWILPAGILWLILLGIQVDSGYLGYETVDAAYYRELAMDFISGRPMVLEGLLNALGNPFSPYPPGYPVLLGLFSQLGGENVDWPVHLILHAVLAFLLVVLWQENLSLIPLGAVLFMDSILSLAASGISEFSFIMVCILVVLCLTRLEFLKQPQWQFLLILGLCTAVFLRYAGVFLFPFLLYKFFMLSMKSREKAHSLLLPLLSFLLASVFLFGTQYAESGMLTGGDRYPNSDSSGYLFLNLMQGLIDQMLIFRDFSGSSLISFLAGLFFLLVYIFTIYKKVSLEEGDLPIRKDAVHPGFGMQFSINLIIAGTFYFAFIIPVRWYFYFAEGFDNRLLAPGAALIWLGILVRNETILYRIPFFLRIAFLIISAGFFVPWRALMSA